MSAPLKVAIIGAGIGAEHLDAYLGLPEQFSVQVICDLDSSKANSIAAPNGIAVVADFHQVLNDPLIDLVDICLPPHLHFDYAKQALQHSKHVICEKPLVPSVKEADELIQLMHGGDSQLFPVFQYRYGLAAAQLQALIDSGLAGKPFVASLETHWHRDAEYYSVPWRGTFDGEQGGAVLGHAIHNHDLLCRFFGQVKSVSAITTTRVNSIETEDCASISFQMDSGAVASSSITLGAADDTSRLRFCFDKLTATSGTAPYAPAMDDWTFQARGDNSQEAVDACIRQVRCEHSSYGGFFHAIANSLQGDGGNEVTIDDGRRSIELVAAVYAAATSRQCIDLPLSPDNPYYSSLHPDQKI